MKLANHDEGSDEEEDETPKKVQGSGLRGRDWDKDLGSKSRSDQPHTVGLPWLWGSGPALLLPGP